MITTIYGDMDEAELDKIEGGHENDNEVMRWVEYRLRYLPNSVAIHRSAHIHLKQPAVFGISAVGGVG